MATRETDIPLNKIPDKLRDDPNLPDDERRRRARARTLLMRANADWAEMVKLGDESMAGIVDMVNWLADNVVLGGPQGASLRPEGAVEVGEIITTIAQNPGLVARGVLEGYKEDLDRYGGIAILADAELAGVPILMRLRNAARAINAGKKLDEIKDAYRGVTRLGEVLDDPARIARRGEFEVMEGDNFLTVDGPAGSIVAEKAADGNVYRVTSSTATHKGEGAGTDMYMRLAEEVDARGGSLLSDHPARMSPDAQRLWGSLVDKGVAHRSGGRFAMRPRDEWPDRIPDIREEKITSPGVEAALGAERRASDAVADMRAAIRVDGKVYQVEPGQTHFHARKKAYRADAWPEEFGEVGPSTFNETVRVEEGFAIPGEGFITRMQARERYGIRNMEDLENLRVDAVKRRAEAETALTPDIEPMTELRHYSPERRDWIEPSQQGTGQRGAERARQEAFPDLYPERSYYYAPDQRVEDRFRGASQVEHVVDMPDRLIYDLRQDPDGLIETASALAAADGNFGEQALMTYVELLARERGFEALRDGQKVAVFSRQQPRAVDAPRRRTESRMRTADRLVRDYDTNVSRSIQETGAATYNPRTGNDVSDSGKYAVSPFKMREQVFDRPPTPEEVAEFRIRNNDMFLQHDDVYVGGWKGDDGRYYLDATMLVDNEADARRIALATDQEGYTLLDGDKFPTWRVGESDRSKVQLEAAIKIGDRVYEAGGPLHAPSIEQAILLDNVPRSRASSAQRGFIDPDTGEFMSTAETAAWRQTVVDERDSLQAARDRWQLVQDRPSYRDALEQDMVDNLLPHEYEEYLRAGQRRDLWLEAYAKSPTPREWAALIEAGYDVKDFYPLSQMALSAFGDDAPRFTALVASLSPQRSVEENLKFATEIWERWNRSGRTADEGVLRSFFNADDTSQNNAITVLLSDADALIDEKILREGGLLSGLKVDPFYANLMGETQRLTLDTHMARGIGIEPKAFVKYRNRPVSASMRSGTAYYNSISGRPPINPQQAQAATWAPIRAMTEQAGRRTQGMDAPPSVVDEFFTPPTFMPEQEIRRAMQQAGGGSFMDVIDADPALRARMELLADQQIPTRPAPMAQEIRPEIASESALRGIAQRIDLTRTGEMLRSQGKNPEFLFGIGALVASPFVRRYLEEAHGINQEGEQRSPFSLLNPDEFRD